MKRSSKAITFLSQVFLSPFKVLLKELQSLGLDVRVLSEDGSEVHIMETSDYGDTDLRHVIEGDSRGRRDGGVLR